MLLEEQLNKCEADLEKTSQINSTLKAERQSLVSGICLDKKGRYLWLYVFKSTSCCNVQVVTFQIFMHFMLLLKD